MNKFSLLQIGFNIQHRELPDNQNLGLESFLQPTAATNIAFIYNLSKRVTIRDAKQMYESYIGNYLRCNT